MKMKSSNEHIQNLVSLMNKNNISALDAVNHYTEKNNFDPYFIGDIVKSNRDFLKLLQTDAKKLNIIK